LLWGVQAHPDTVHLRPRAPEGRVFFKVSGALEHRPSNRPMDIHLSITNVLQDALVRRGLATFIMMLRESIHRHWHAASRQANPLLRYRNYSAGHNQLNTRRRLSSGRIRLSSRWRTRARHLPVRGARGDASRPIRGRLPGRRHGNPIGLVRYVHLRGVYHLCVTSGAAQRALARDLDGEHLGACRSEYDPNQPSAHPQ
jgi:hypothetical protein